MLGNTPPISSLASWLGDEVASADFPQTLLRFRNGRAASTIGLDDMSDAEWIAHFGRFEPLPNNLAKPLALKYHGHQFGHYNPDIGDGRGFLFAQLEDENGRWLDLGTKGSGTTPYSRSGDGRLTLKGGVREILASEMLEALGVNTSKSFSLIETGESLVRGDEPSPTRSAVLVRLSHSHIRIGTFQRLNALGLEQEMRDLIGYCLTHYPGNAPPDDAPGRDEPAAILLHHMAERLADLAASYMVAGFVHGVLNTDNINITGESFDYGPWRFIPYWEPNFVAAYFDHEGRYAFGRQPQAMRWNLGQMAIALRLVCDAPPLIAALERFDNLYGAALRAKWCQELGITPRGREDDNALIMASIADMQSHKLAPHIFFFQHRSGALTSGAASHELGEILSHYAQVAPHLTDANDSATIACESLLIDEVETLWSAIDQHDNWHPLLSKIDAIRRFAVTRTQHLVK